MDATESIRKECGEYAQNAAVIVDAMQAEKAEIPVCVGERHYVVTIRRARPCTDERMCSGCFAGTGCTNPAKEDAEDRHASDCAMHNMPTYPNGPCDCGHDDFRIGESVEQWEDRTGFVGTLHSEALNQLHAQVQRLLANATGEGRATRE